MHGRGYPADMVEVYGVDLPGPRRRPGDDRRPAGLPRAELLLPPVVADDPDGPAPYARQVRGARRRRAPHGLGGPRRRARAAAAAPDRASTAPRRSYVTENGSAWPDVVGPDGAIDDPERIAYLEEHLAACARAVAQGAPLAGYFAWSLLDNFEWALRLRQALRPGPRRRAPSPRTAASRPSGMRSATCRAVSMAATTAMSPATTTIGWIQDLDLIKSIGRGCLSLLDRLAAHSFRRHGGPVDEEGPGFTDRLVDGAARERGHQDLWATLYHWDLPLTLGWARGGWTAHARRPMPTSAMPRE